MSWDGWQGWHGYIALWCALCAAVALLGYGRSLAGMTRAQRTVRATGRVERVGELRHGASRRDGVPVVVTFQDPASGQEFTVTNDRDRGETVTAAWPGRTVALRYHRGRPHAYQFHFTGEVPGETPGPDRGLTLPNCAVFLIYAGLVTGAAIEWGWPWALIATCGPLALGAAIALPDSLRATERRRRRTATLVAVPGQVVAVLRDVSTDGEGSSYTTLTPVVVFTTLDGTAVTAYCPTGIPDPEHARGRTVTVHYDPANPAHFTPVLASEQRSHELDDAFTVLFLLATAAATVVGVVLVL
ncbi:DUF3592 domain-containing protein [Streptomyces sp. NPDC093252]|uniref:DUF3592 domain-containing protein n=1 Tax=Streptomyces sp. NPDC093252 TaxID=3154980 RepID=UPI003433C10D